MPQVKVLVGADPEVFLRDSHGRLVSAHDILPGTKEEPHKVPYGAVQVDGVAAEFNIDPASTESEFVRNISEVVTSLKSKIPGLTLHIEPYATFDKGYFSSLPDKTRELGCNPDYNAWTGEVNPAPDGLTSTRTASGHLHIGWCKDVSPMSRFHFEDCRSLVKQLDYFLGMYSLMWDEDDTRRKMYGMAGAFRPKSYGVEYRVLSNTWLKSPRLQKWIYNTIQSAVQVLLSGDETMEEQFSDYAQRVINGNIIDWYKTPEGQNIAACTGLSWPNLTDYGKKPPLSAYDQMLAQLRRPNV